VEHAVGESAEDVDVGESIEDEDKWAMGLLGTADTESDVGVTVFEERYIETNLEISKQRTSAREPSALWSPFPNRPR
jgi:hypothetical protein